MDVAHDYALLALRVDRLVAEHPTGSWILDYRGPEQWRTRVADEPLAKPADLVRAAADLEAAVAAGDPALAEQIRALGTVARRLAGERLSLPEQVRDMLGIDAEWIADEVFEEAHRLLDEALPATKGTLAQRLHAWRAAHSLPAGRSDRLTDLIQRAVTESRRRAEKLLPLPDNIDVTVEFAPGPFRGLYRGGTGGTVYVDPNLPFNLADLFYVVAHESIPGHICEFMLKQLHQGHRPDIQVRFMPSPAYVVSEGIGLHAPQLLFPGDEAQRWLLDNIEELQPDPSNYAKIQHARNILWGAYCNAALLLADATPWPKVRDYLADTALITDDESTFMHPFLTTPFTESYIFTYYHGWRLLRPHLQNPTFLHRALTEQLAVSSLQSSRGNGASPVAEQPDSRRRE
ncbi:DUF885 domain-containing protein [Nocardia sp. CDC159]|uniref:DUF885 domain-containing protein n=1 Tax=Nocardia pulmonis TaxID=2951408 RepID=A0A9X2IY56_9NOCA|nr:MULTISPECIES: DUF885 domain-containing protein [Nocardia]MCM6774610.1 DUF885 domain-containing protein [Nocardia pulmonis]MCM6787325.1 DUF885 domain-containing protein [Nocardia sp. CDC159]